MADNSAATVSLVVAYDRDQAIGRDGDLPWHLPDDLKRFRAITMGKPIIMGRRTHESIGRPLPGRRNVVLSTSESYRAAGCDHFCSLADALHALRDSDEVMLIGGAAVYASGLPLATRLYVTEVDAAVGGDVFFPPFDRAAWRETAREAHAADDTHAWPFAFVTLERVSPPPQRR